MFGNFIRIGIDRFIQSEEGAATVDWVVGAGAGVMLAIGITNMIGGATIDHTDRIEDKFTEVSIRTY